MPAHRAEGGDSETREAGRGSRRENLGGRGRLLAPASISRFPEMPICLVCQEKRRRTRNGAGPDDNTSRQRGCSALSGEFQNANGCGACAANTGSHTGGSSRLSLVFFLLCHLPAPLADRREVILAPLPRADGAPSVEPPVMPIRTVRKLPASNRGGAFLDGRQTGQPSVSQAFLASHRHACTMTRSNFQREARGSRGRLRSVPGPAPAVRTGVRAGAPVHPHRRRSTPKVRASTPGR